MKTLIKNGIIVNEGQSSIGSILIDGNIIDNIFYLSDFNNESEYNNTIIAIEESLSSKDGVTDNCNSIIDATGLHVIPGVIDDQVHFREPGNTHKATIGSESKAAVLGGVTSFMDMPNNNPPVTTLETLENKFSIAAESSYANYSFYLGATNDNIGEIKGINPKSICGLKVFMGSSTGNMLVNDDTMLDRIFKESPVLIATHCEDEQTIRENLEHFKAELGENIPFEKHPEIRSREACVKCSKKAIDLAVKNSSNLHILHLSTADEMEMLKEAKKYNPNISGEVCVHYMWFNKNDYKKYGSKMKCNPAIKEESDMHAIRNAVKEGIIDVIATDHAPHLKEEKSQGYLSAPSGLPLVQHSLQLMLELYKKGIFTIEEVVQKMSHGPAIRFQVNGRGYIRKGYFADIAVVDTNKPDNHSTSSPAYKCGWSPFEGYTFSSSVVHTFVNGTRVVSNGHLTSNKNSMRLEFDR